MSLTTRLQATLKKISHPRHSSEDLRKDARDADIDGRRALTLDISATSRPAVDGDGRGSSTPPALVESVRMMSRSSSPASLPGMRPQTPLFVSNRSLNQLRTMDGPSELHTKGSLSSFRDVPPAAVDSVDQIAVAKGFVEHLDIFWDTMPDIMGALKEVSKLHPLLEAAFLIFHAVYTLEETRRDNDKKITALYVQMSDMMTAFLQLQEVYPDPVQYPDGILLPSPLERLLASIPEDLQAGANLCDTYQKLKLPAKVLQSLVWDRRFMGLMAKFSDRRSAIERQLIIHISQTLGKTSARLQSTMDRIDFTMDAFQSFVSDKHQWLSSFVSASGGPQVVINDDALLTNLIKKDLRTASKRQSYRGGDASTETQAAIEEIKEQLKRNSEEALQHNLNMFSRKLEVQKQQIVDEVLTVVTRAGDRQLEELKRSVKQGPHDLIVDATIHEIWETMRWPGYIKAHHFVLALRDHYVEKQLRLRAEARAPLSMVDAWAIQYISISNLQPILEAFDDDASGFITAIEVNAFTSARPLEWSLQRWIAFWAVGWRSAIIEYAVRVEVVFAKMVGIIPHVLPENRSSVERYIRLVWPLAHALTTTLKTENSIRVPCQDHFMKYVAREEERLQTELKKVEYNIDGVDTLRLVAGTGRFEKAATICVISGRELKDAQKSMYAFNDGVVNRVGDLHNVFDQSRFLPRDRFKKFAYGIYQFVANENLWTEGYIRAHHLAVIPPAQDLSSDETVIEKILRYRHKQGSRSTSPSQQARMYHETRPSLWASCDHCGRGCHGVRLLCLDCVRPSGLDFDTVDLCGRDECLSAHISGIEGLDSPHEPTHRLLKVRTVILVQEFGQYYREAYAAWDKVGETCTKLAIVSKTRFENKNSGKAVAYKPLGGEDAPSPISPVSFRSSVITFRDFYVPLCAQCEKPVALPCWYCTRCKEDLFLCDPCDSTTVGVRIRRKSGLHTADHALIRCQEPRDDLVEECTIEQRLTGMETQMEELRAGLQGVSGSLQQILQRLVEPDHEPGGHLGNGIL
ncbi:hypothetical protein FA95DRAFT_699202 [Auriscalpium vulgare]|uniref:Uncharacterized protein n=1 Tax=Auriscalpium vulgare TaxID=40419 RepID=A0ACB8S138_9AGAM|nr:hypothetical protein FA95DRAFT_699202 [Auriscalpium vulgare]